MGNRSALLTAALLGLAGSALAQSGDSTVNRSAQVASPGLSRAEVLADLAVFDKPAFAALAEQAKAQLAA